MSDNETKQEAADVITQEKTESSTTTRKSFISIIKANPLYDEASKIFHWQDPVRSGLLFGVINFLYILLTWGDYTVITLISYLLLALLGVCFAYSNYVVLRASWLQGKTVPNPFVERFKDQDCHITRESIDKHVDTLLDLINLTIDEYRQVFYCTDNLLSLRFALYFYLAATVGEWFSGFTILYLVALGFFVWPRLYQEKQKEIDQLFEIAKAQANVYFQLALSKLPPAVTQRFPMLKPKST